MASTVVLRAIMLPLIASWAVVGSYGTMVIGFKNGLFDSITNSVARADNPYVHSNVQPLKTTFTGIPVLDSQLLILVAFFSYIVDGAQTWAITASYWYLIIQLFAACCLLFLEGLRKGNSGSIVSWTGVVGLLFQNIEYTITVPVYLVLHALTSPTASLSVSVGDVLPANPLEPSILLLSNFLAFIVPAVAMALPAPSVVSAATHYTWLAIWQGFPLWQSVFQWTFSRIASALGFSGPSETSPHGSPASTAVVYRVTLFLAVTSHVLLLSTACIPSSIIPAERSTLLAIFDEVTLKSAVIPPLFSTPSVNPNLSPIPADALAPLVQLFLQFDVYCGSAALLLWAIYLYRVAAQPSDRFRWTSLAGKALGWTAVGGPVAAAAFLLWERDEMLARSYGGAETKKRL